MKTNLLSALRHLLTFLAGLGTFIATSAPQADGGGVDPAAAGLGALAAVVTRYLLSLAPLVGAREMRAMMSDTRGRRLAWAAAAGLAGFFGFSLPACTPFSKTQDGKTQDTRLGQARLGTPWAIRASYVRDGARVDYSSAKGVMVTVDRRSNK